MLRALSTEVERLRFLESVEPDPDSPPIESVARRLARELREAGFDLAPMSFEYEPQRGVALDTGKFDA
jgi:hypothetical protein